MGNLTATNQWVDVPYFEPNAVLTGGPDCPDNVPIQALTDRTEYLKGMVNQQNQGKLDKSGGAMTGTLLLKLGAVTPGNVNNAGLSFAGDGDTGVFSARDGNLQIASNGQVVIELDDMSPTYFRRGVRTPKGAPVGADVNASSGYTFGGDGDTGLFAEGGSDGGGSDLVMRVDNVDFARIKNGKGLVLSGTPETPTADASANDGRIANTAFVQRAIAALINAAPGALDTLQELAAALGDDANFAATISSKLATKLSLSGGAMDGTILLKQGAAAPRNGANVGMAFANDSDTGMFSPRDGILQLASNGVVIMESGDYGYLSFSRGVRTPKGAPGSSDSSALSGYAFADDGDTGLFAEGGVSSGGSDLVMRVDGVDFVRITNGQGVVLSGTTQAPTPSDVANDGQIATTFFVQRALASMLGAPIGAATGGAASGWCRLPGGLILQWGVVAYGNRNTAVNVAFPITFPHAVLSLQHSTADGEGEVVSVGAGNPSTSGASFILRGVYGTTPDGGVLHYTVLGY